MVMTSSVQIKNNQLIVGKERISLLSGEVHYWRLNPHHWSRCLDRAKEMGLKVIASYVCWDYHEYEQPRKAGQEGKFDFHGKTDPQRNLAAYLDMLEEKGFWIIIRPGPYVYTEWVNAGVPTYIARYHRMHPEFLKAAKRYMEKVVEVVKPHLATNGGRVVLWQADNEIDPFVGWYAEQLGLSGERGMFQDFLEEKYRTIKRLNDRWGADYGDFHQARATQSLLIKDKESIIRYLDFKQFVWWYVNKKAKWMVDTYRTLGVDVPIYLNTYPDVWVQNWREMNEIADLVGIDQYPVNEFTESEREQREFLERMIYARAVCRIPYIAEFESGIWHGFHYKTKVLSANHYRLICCTALQGGIAGWNWYMLVNRDNWYMSPINERGWIRPELFKAFKDIVSTYNQMKPAELEKLTDTAVSYSTLYRASSLSDPDHPTLVSLYDADIDYEFFDTGDSSHRQSNKPILFYYGGERLDKVGQQRLVDYVENGGNLMFFTSYPYLDDAMEQLNLLGIKKPDEVIESRYVEITLGETKVRVQSPLFSYCDVPGKAIVAEQVFRHGSQQEETDYLFNLEVGRKVTVGYTERRGKGTVAILGCHPNADVVIALHRHFKIPIYARSTTSGVHTSLFRSPKNSYYLIVTNNGEESKCAEIHLEQKLFGRKKSFYRMLPDGERLSISFERSPVLHIDVARKNGVVVELQMKEKGGG